MATDPSAQSDETLLMLLAQGSHAAFASLTQRHAKRFYASVYYMLQNREDAEDVVQEAFLKLWRQPQLWDASRGAKFTTWFHRVVVNAALDLKRKRRMKTEELGAADGMESDAQPIDERIDAAMRKTLVENAIKSLPDHQQLALNLCFYQELSNQEAAEIMGLNLKALQSLVMRAKTALKAKLNAGEAFSVSPAAERMKP